MYCIYTKLIRDVDINIFHHINYVHVYEVLTIYIYKIQLLMLQNVDQNNHTES